MTRAWSKSYWLLLPLLIIAALLLLWDWNWFRPLLERGASAAINRAVHITDLDVALSMTPTIRASGITVDNPEGFPATESPVAEVAEVKLQIALRDLFGRRVHLMRLDISEPVARLRSAPNSQRNWQFELPPADTTPESNPWQLQIDALTIESGHFSVIDQILKADFAGTVSTRATTAGAEPALHAELKGRYDGSPLHAEFVGGSALRLRDAVNPYLVDFSAESGDTHMTLKGSLLDPLQFKGANLQLLLSGKNLGDLIKLTRLPLPNTPAFRLQGQLDYRAGSIVFENFQGLMGETDIAGDFQLRRQAPRPLMTISLRANQVRLQDLSGFIGGNPNEAAADAPGGEGRLLPSQPINLPQLQYADAIVDFEGKQITGEKLPFDRLAFKLTLDDGVVRVSPMDIGIGDGSLRVFATLDPRGEQLGLEFKADLRRVDVSRLMQKTGYQGSGRIGGQATLNGKGRSVAELLGSGNGELKLAMAGGNFSALLLDLSGLDFGNALLAALGIGKRTEVRCLVGDFSLADGQFDTRSFVLDTGNSNLFLDGGANLKDESLNFRLHTKPKRANIGRLRAPIEITGTLADPNIRPDFVELGLRGGAALVLGTLLTPLAALLPTLQLGPGEDRDCQRLLAEAETQAPPQPKP